MFEKRIQQTTLEVQGREVLMLLYLLLDILKISHMVWESWLPTMALTILQVNEHLML